MLWAWHLRIDRLIVGAYKCQIPVHLCHGQSRLCTEAPKKHFCTSPPPIEHTCMCWGFPGLLQKAMDPPPPRPPRKKHEKSTNTRELFGVSSIWFVDPCEASIFVSACWQEHRQVPLSGPSNRNRGIHGAFHVGHLLADLQRDIFCIFCCQGFPPLKSNVTLSAPFSGAMAAGELGFSRCFEACTWRLQSVAT